MLCKKDAPLGSEFQVGDETKAEKWGTRPEEAQGIEGEEIERNEKSEECEGTFTQHCLLCYSKETINHLLYIRTTITTLPVLK